uniref:Glc8 protein n=1 Tax=Nakaseomyces delphensis TaxID=51657 RepID=Q707Z8_NAKDE|nr:Glc8 protein [Nakaseomyces delphensis]
MGGILKNALPSEERQKEREGEQSVSEFRQQVYKNTQLNAQLTSRKRDTPIDELHLGEPSEGVPPSPGRRRGPPKDTLLMKREQDAREKAKKEGTEAMTEEERLQWNQKNLEENEVTKQQYQDIHIDEPKTPYQGAVDPEGEYYRVDDDDEEKKDDIDDFSLGEPEYKVDETASADDVIEEGEDQELSKEEKHKKFEEMRKKHYNVKEIFQNKKNLEDDEE